MACSAFTRVTTYRLAKSPNATLYTRGFDGFVTSAAAPIATGWSESSSRAGLIPAVDQRLFTAHCKRLITTAGAFQMESGSAFAERHAKMKT